MESSLEEAVKVKEKRDRLRLLSIAKLAAKAGGVDGKEISDMISVGHAQNLMEGCEDGDALGTKEVCDVARKKIRAGEEVVKHLMIAMACARAMGGDRAEDAAVEIWRDALGADGGSIWARAEIAGGEEERDTVIRSGDFYSAVLTYAKNGGEYGLEGEGGRIERVLAGGGLGGKGGKGARRAVVMARAWEGVGRGGGEGETEMDERQ
jgi:hypothetical protein